MQPFSGIGKRKSNEYYRRVLAPEFKVLQKFGRIDPKREEINAELRQCFRCGYQWIENFQIIPTIRRGIIMKVYIAGGEGLTSARQKAVFQAGCRWRLISSMLEQH